MINNRVGCFPQATVNTLLDESYLVVKSVYLRLREIVDVSEHLDTITTLAEHLEEIENVQTAANRVNRVWESIDNIDRLTQSADNIDTVAGISKDISDVVKISDEVVIVAHNINSVKAVADDLDSVKAVADTKDEIHQVVDNLDVIKNAKQNADNAQEYALNALNTSIQLKDYIAQKEVELDKISGTYYMPSVSKEGILSWTNTGGRTNPDPVNIKGEPGTSIVLKGQVESYDDLVEKYPTGNLGDIYQTKDTQDVWGWDVNQNCWVNFGVLKGAKGDDGKSANEILMDPDPELYFLSLYGGQANDVLMDPDPEQYFLDTYGETHEGDDGIGVFVMPEPAFEPDPEDVLNSILKE